MCVFFQVESGRAVLFVVDPPLGRGEHELRQAGDTWDSKEAAFKPDTFQEMIAQIRGSPVASEKIAVALYCDQASVSDVSQYPSVALWWGVLWGIVCPRSRSVGVLVWKGDGGMYGKV